MKFRIMQIFINEFDESQAGSAIEVDILEELRFKKDREESLAVVKSEEKKKPGSDGNGKK